ncbi:MAG: BBP7 family outer membrane beta-barrel protein [Pirellulaceae bacterium]|nr:BBP7 family outer membrane beta-barrel protein [Pirellulaceae bacterium]
MRRTTICLAIVALLLGVPVSAQEYMPGYPTSPTLSADPLPAGGEMATGQIQTMPEPPQAARAPGDPAPQQQWQPLEQVAPSPDVTVSGELVPGGVMQQGMMAGPMPDEYPRGPCCEKTGRGYCCPPNWYLDQRVRVMYHSKTKWAVIGAYGTIGQAWDGTQFVDRFFRVPGMTTRSGDTEPAAGYEVTLGHYLGRDTENRDQFVEFTYYGLNEWDEGYALYRTDRPTVTNGSLWPNQEQIANFEQVTFGNLFSRFDNDLAGFNRADDLEQHYTSRFDNFELNLRIRPRARTDRLVMYQNGRWRREAQNGPTCSFLAGLRALSLDESFSLSGRGTIRTQDFLNDTDTTAVTTGDYAVRTYNDLVGLQIGLDMLWRQGFFEMGVLVKGGAFVNFADMNSSLVSTGGLDDPMANQDLYDASGPYTNVNNRYTQNREASIRDVAGVAEFGLTAAYQLRKNIVLRAAYDMMWVNGLAMAPEQINGQVGAPGRINNDGLQLLQSLSLGLEVDW